MKILKVLAPLFVIALLVSGCQKSTDTPKSDAKSLVSFKFEAAKNPGLAQDYSATYNESTNTWDVGPLPPTTVVTSLIASFEVSAGASVKVRGVAQASGTTPNDFTGDVAYVVTAEDGSSSTYTISVDVTVQLTNRDISSISIVKDTYYYAGVILEKGSDIGNTISFYVPGVSDYSSSVLSFTNSDKAIVSDGSGNILTSGCTLDLSSQKTISVTSESGISKQYTLTAYAKPAMEITAFDPDNANDGFKWIEVTVNRKAELSKVLLGASTYSYDNSVIADITALSFWSSVADGDAIRVWNTGFLSADDTAKSDNSPAVWDVMSSLSSSNLLNYSYGILYLSSNSEIFNAVGYVMNTTSSTYWVTNTTVLSGLAAAANKGYWGSSERTGAFTFPATVNPSSTVGLVAGAYASRISGSTGTSSASWEAKTDGAYCSLTAAVSGSVNAGAASDITVTATLTSQGTVTVDPAKATVDLSAIGGTASTALTETATGSGIWTATYNVPSSYAAGSYSLPVSLGITVNGLGITKTYTPKLTILPAKSVSVTAVTATPSLVTRGIATDVSFSVTTGAANNATVTGVSADLSAIGGGAAVALSGSGGSWSLTYNVPTTVAVGSYTITFTASDSSAGVSGTGTTSLVVSSDPFLSVSSFAASPAAGIVGSATTVTLTAVLSTLNDAAATSVTADLSAFTGLSAAEAFTGSADGLTWTYSLNVGASQAAGNYPIMVTATDSLHTLTATKTTSFGLSAPLAFANSDMEAPMHNTTPGANGWSSIVTALIPASSAYESVIGPKGTSSVALHVSGATTANSFIFASAKPLNAKGTYTKICFWVKGSISANTSIAVQIGSSGTAAGQLFWIGSVGASDVVVNGDNTLKYTLSANPFTFDTSGSWRKITLNLSGYLASVATTAYSTVTDNNNFSVKIGKNATADFYIDDILYE